MIEEGKMLLEKKQWICLFSITALVLLICVSGWAGETKPQAKEILVQNQKGSIEPTAVNLWKAKQAGDQKTADLIRTIMDREAEKSWSSSSCDDKIIGQFMPLSPPTRNDAFLKTFNWGNDVTIAAGPVSNGISADYCADSLYAVRCTTYNGMDNARMVIYKSTDEGANWKYFSGIYTTSAQYSYPVILTGTSSSPDRLYLFYLRSSQDGDIYLARFTQHGTFEGFFQVKTDVDTITYFSACTNYGLGNRLMVAYQKEITDDTTANLYTITSTDYGVNWSNNVWLDSDGSHPDIAYGSNGYVYLTYVKTGEYNDEIHFGRSDSYCTPGSWEYFQALTADFWNDNYPKVAALHTSPSDAPYVWVAYTHDVNNSGNWDMRYAYSSNGGSSWSRNHYLAYSTDYDEMGCDLWVGRNTDLTFVNICFLKSLYVNQKDQSRDIYWGYTNTSHPDNWNLFQINDYWGAIDGDGRKVCSGTYGDIATNWSGVVYAGSSIYSNYYNLYFDNRKWTDVEEEIVDEGKPEDLSLLDNYPNPFNPETRISYTIGTSGFSHVRLQVFNVLGQRVKTLVDDQQAPGSYEVTWDGKDESGAEAASGIYFYKLEADQFNQTKKMVLVR
jgi:hypothetical protein